MIKKTLIISIVFLYSHGSFAFSTDTETIKVKKIKTTATQLKYIKNFEKNIETLKKKIKTNKSLTKKNKILQLMEINTFNSLLSIINKNVKKKSLSKKQCKKSYDEIIQNFSAGNGFNGVYPVAVKNGLIILSTLCKDPKLAKTPKIAP